MTIDRPITIAITLFVIILLIFFLVWPAYNDFLQLRLELGKKEAEYNAKVDYYNAIAKTYSDIQSRPDDIAKVDDALPTASDLGKIVYFLQQKAKEGGLVVKSIFLSKSSTGSSGSGVGVVKTMTFSADLSGSYPALGQFMSSLEKSARIFEVTSISFGSTTGNSLGSFNLQIATHSY